MIWNKPKAFIQNVTLIFAIFSLLFAAFWFGIYYIWQYNPNIVSDYDKSLNNTYINHITRLQTRTHKGKSPEDTFERHKILVNALGGITSLHKFYKTDTTSKKYIVSYLIDNNRLIEAKETAYKWQKELPYDFNAKYKYIEVLKKTNPKEALKYYDSVFKKHNDIYDFSQNYINYLINQGMINKAEYIAKTAIKNYKTPKNTVFMYYYTNSEYEKFHSESKLNISNVSHQKTNGFYLLNLDIEVKGLTRLRFDIDNLPLGSKISNLMFDFKTARYNLSNITAKPLHSLFFENNTFTVTGNDPYVEVMLPTEIINTNEKVSITTKLNIERAQVNPLKNLTHHKEWKVYYANEARFNEKDSNQFYITKNQNTYSADISVNSNSYQYLRLDLPSIKNLHLYDLTINNQDKQLDLTDYQLINIEQNTDGSFRVTNKDPYIIFNVPQAKSPKHLSMHFSLGEEQ